MTQDQSQVKRPQVYAQKIPIEVAEGGQGCGFRCQEFNDDSQISSFLWSHVK